MCLYKYEYIHPRICPTQSIMYVPLQVDIFHKCILLIVEYKYLKSCSGYFILQNPILRTRSCGTGFIAQYSWPFHFHQTTLVWWKCFVPQLYQFRKGISGRQALNFFYMIHRGGRVRTDIYPCIYIFILHTFSYLSAHTRIP